MQFLLTGSSGFIGRHLHQHLRDCGHTVHILQARTFSTAQQQSWLEYCRKIRPTAILHLAGLAHRIPPCSAESVHQLWTVNVRFPVQLAAVAAEAGVPRFVFVSSIGVHGGLTPSGLAFREDSPFNPENLYAESKCEAEIRLQQILAPTPTQLVTVRPALVCGRGAPGNIRRLAHLVKAGLPLPLANVANQRSFVVIENLCDLLARAATNPAAAGEVFLAAESETLSISEVMTYMARHWKRGARVWPCPQKILTILLQAAGFQAEAKQLLGSLVVDSSKARAVLNWQSIKSLQQSLCESADLNIGIA